MRELREYKYEDRIEEAMRWYEMERDLKILRQLEKNGSPTRKLHDSNTSKHRPR